MNLRPAATLAATVSLALGGLLLAIPAHASDSPAPEPSPTLTAPQLADHAPEVTAVRSWLLPAGHTPDSVAYPQTPVDPSKCVPDNPGWIQVDTLHGTQAAIDHLSAPDSPASVNLAAGEDSALYVSHVWAHQLVCAVVTPTPTATATTPTTPIPSETPTWTPSPTPAPTHSSPATPSPTTTPKPAATSPSSTPSATSTTPATPQSPTAGPGQTESSATAAAVTGDRAGLNKQLADRSLAMTGSDTSRTALISTILLVVGLLMLLVAYGPGVVRRIRTRR